MSIPKFKNKDRLPVEHASGMQNPSQDSGVLPGHLRDLLAPLFPAHHKWTDGPKLQKGQQVSSGVFPSWTEGKGGERKKGMFFPDSYFIFQETHMWLVGIVLGTVTWKTGSLY